MKAKLLILIIALAMIALTGCATTCSNGSCGGCVVSYWSTTCPIPNSGGASESAFTDVANVSENDSCSSHSCNPCSYSPCSSCGGMYDSGPNW